MAFVSSTVSSNHFNTNPQLSKCGERQTIAARQKSVLSMAKDSGVWKGDWICVDCGYEYSRGQKVAFENLPDSWRCPQCRAPKRRFAKKAGEKIADSGSTSNTPIVIVSMVGLIGLLAFSVW
eukprot:CAMPEP_0182450930 /NCGR_PEP_ID=MMETSP1172-20130603/43441_1 /TAXON_ID=708627 /ORGANISM="Timspurckia oligopyrenoides, Strain CCMP3278" /LENGTH=121 /DNA_ID=CAMNT_0024648655 /DNA_START=110 /DNA_END=472 /DNA_ORIENTATION=-